MNKKIAILTCGLQDNYGANLQAYATQEFVNSKGCFVRMINYNFENEKSYSPLAQRHIKSFVASILFYSLRKSIYKSFKGFRSTYMKYSKKIILDEDDLRNELKNYDLIIIGSDQVWNPYSEINRHFTLLDFYDVNEGPKRVSYASSFGVRELPESMAKMYGDALKNFDMLSVREESGKRIIDNLFENNVKIVVDPVFLISTLDWEQIARPVEELKGKQFVFVYDLWHAPETRDIAAKVAKKLHCDTYILSRNTFNDKRVKNLYGIGPCEFIWLVKNASYVVTDSFHGTAFSIIFRKNFWIYCSDRSKSLSDRIEFILKNFGLTQRLVSNIDDVTASEVNYKEVPIEAEKWINASKKYFVKALEV